MTGGGEPRCVHAQFGQAQAGRRQGEADGDQHHALAAPAVDGRLAVTAARVRRGGRAPGTPAATPALLTAARGPPLRPALAVVAVTVVGVVGVVVTFGVVVSVVAFVTALAAEVLVSAGIAALAATAVVIVITVTVIAAVVAGRLVCRRAPGVRLRRVRLLGVGPGVGLLGVRLRGVGLRLVRGGRIRA